MTKPKILQFVWKSFSLLFQVIFDLIPRLLMKTGEELKKWHLEFQETSSNESLNQCNSNEFPIENASDLVSESDEVDEEILDQTSASEMNTFDAEDDLNNEQNENSNIVEETETKKINWFRK